MENPFAGEASADIVLTTLAVMADSTRYAEATAVRAVLLSHMLGDDGGREVLDTAQAVVDSVRESLNLGLPVTTEACYRIAFHIRENVIPRALEIDRILGEHGLAVSDDNGIGFPEAIQSALQNL